jgi:hypothetical protein
MTAVGFGGGGVDEGREVINPSNGSNSNGSNERCANHHIRGAQTPRGNNYMRAIAMAWWYHWVAIIDKQNFA